MKRNVLAYIFSWFLSATAFASGYDIRTSDILDQPGLEVLGDFKGSWYVISFEKPGTLNKPPRYKIVRYAPGVRTAQSSELYPSFGEKTLYLGATFFNNKVSLFYARVTRNEDIEGMLDNREGHKSLAYIYRQDYDPNTLLTAGEAQLVFTDEEDNFSASGIELSTSEDKSKTAILVKSYYRQTKFKIIVNDNKSGQQFAKTYDLKGNVKEFLKYYSLKVSNEGRALVAAKVRNDVISMSTSSSKDKKPVLYYFFAVGQGVDEPKKVALNTPVSSGKYSDDPVISALANGSLIIAYDYFSSDKSNLVKGISVTKYDADLNVTGSRDIPADAKFTAMASAYQSAKDGYQFLEIQQILPLEGGNFMLFAEYHKVTDGKDKNSPKTVDRNYVLAFRLDESVGLKATNFIDKKQQTTSVDYAFSARSYHKGNEVYMVYNDTWEGDGEHSMNLMCTHFPADGGEPETKKVVRTSDDFFTSLQRIYPGNNGKVLLSVEKVVEFEDVSRQFKLLEVTAR